MTPSIIKKSLIYNRDFLINDYFVFLEWNEYNSILSDENIIKSEYKDYDGFYRQPSRIHCEYEECRNHIYFYYPCYINIGRIFCSKRCCISYKNKRNAELLREVLIKTFEG